MAAATADRPTKRRIGKGFSYPVGANKKCYVGTLAVLNAGNAEPGSTALNLKCVGMFSETVDNTGGAAAAVRAQVERGCFAFANSASADEITLADVNADCYIVDDQTVAKTSGSNTRSIAGKVRDVTAEGVWVEV